MSSTVGQPSDLLRVLHDHGVEFVLVGGAAAVLHGAPIYTLDVDIVHRRDPDNVARLTAALRAIHAYYWEHIGKRLEPEERTLLLEGHHLLSSDYGNIDVLGAIGDQQGYDQLVGRSVRCQLADDVVIDVLCLEAIIDTKRAAGRPKDLAVLPELLETLRQTQITADDES